MTPTKAWALIALVLLAGVCAAGMQSVALGTEGGGITAMLVVTDDSDQDGCTDSDEQQSSVGSQTSGGLRNNQTFWDFFDTPNVSNVRDRAVASADFNRVLQRFGANDSGPGTFDRFSDPLSAPNAFAAGQHRANYHPAFDRGPSSGPNAWNLTAPNGAIAAPDFFRVLAQFGHNCN